MDVSWPSHRSEVLTCSALICHVTGNEELGKNNKALKRELTAVDAGGVSREFFSQVWRQMGSLHVKCDGKSGEKQIRLFDNEVEAGFVPVQDDIIVYQLRELTKCGKVVVMKKIKAYYRAIGRLMIHWLATDPVVSFETFQRDGGMDCGHTIDETAIPTFYRNGSCHGVV